MRTPDFASYASHARLGVHESCLRYQPHRPKARGLGSLGPGLVGLTMSSICLVTVPGKSSKRMPLYDTHEAWAYSTRLLLQLSCSRQMICDVLRKPGYIFTACDELDNSDLCMESVDLCSIVDRCIKPPRDVNRYLIRDVEWKKVYTVQ